MWRADYTQLQPPTAPRDANLSAFRHREAADELPKICIPASRHEFAVASGTCGKRTGHQKQDLEEDAFREQCASTDPQLCIILKQ